MGALADPWDPSEMEHKLQLATHRQHAGGQDGASLNELTLSEQHYQLCLDLLVMCRALVEKVLARTCA